MRRVLEEAFDQGKVEIIDEVLDPDFVCYDPNSESGEIHGSETIRVRWSTSARLSQTPPTLLKTR